MPLTLNPENFDPAVAPLVEKINQDREELIRRGYFEAQSEDTVSTDPPAAQESAPEPEPAVTAEPSHEPETAPAPAGEPTPEPDWKAELERERQRARTSDGMLKAQGQQLREAQARLAELEAQRTAPPPKPADAPAGPSPEETARRARLEAEFGKDVVEAFFAEIDQRAESKAKAAAQPIRDEFAPLRQTVEQVSQSAQERATREFQERVLAAVPRAGQIYQDPAFLEFLGEDGIAILNGHAQRFDAERVAGIFQKFEKLTAPQSAAATISEPDPAAALKERSDRQRAAIAAQAQPRSGASASPAGEPRHYSYEQWRQARRELATGNYTDAEIAKLNHEYTQAWHEGRVGKP